MNLTLGNPALALGLLAAAIPLAVHLFFRRRPRPLPFPAIDFVLRARRENERRLRLRKILLFAARTLLLAAVAAAVLRPRLEKPGQVAAAVPVGPRATAIVLDASGSMRYRLGGKTLFERARSDALGALLELTSEEPATLVVCGGEPPHAEPLGFDRAALRRLIETAQASARYSDLTSCLSEAARALGDTASVPGAIPGMGRRIVVATNLVASSWRLEAPPPEVDGPGGPSIPEISVKDAARGSSLPNSAVTALGIDPDPTAGPRGYRVNVKIANYGGALKDVPVSLSVGLGKDAHTVIRSFVDLPANGEAKKSLALSFPSGGPAFLRVALPGDGLVEDDARALSVLVPKDVRVLIVDGAPSPIRFLDEATFVEEALASPSSPVHAKVIDAEALPTQDLSEADVVFLLNVRSVGSKAEELRRFVEGGGGLFVSVGDQIDVDAYAKEMASLLPMALNVEKTAAERGTPGAEAHAARFADIDFTCPVFSVFSGEAKEGLLGVRTYRYLTVKPPGRGAEARVIARFDDGSPALVESQHGKGKVLLFTSTADHDWTDWPIRTSFLPSMQRFAGYLAGSLDERRDVPVLVGEKRALEPDEGDKVSAVISPDGKDLRNRPEDGIFARGSDGALFVRPEVPGLWQVEVTGANGQRRLEPRLAFSATFDPRESDTRRLDPDELSAHLGGTAHAKVEGSAQAAGTGRSIPLWTVLLALGTVAFVLEGVLIA